MSTAYRSLGISERRSIAFTMSDQIPFQGHYTNYLLTTNHFKNLTLIQLQSTYNCWYQCFRESKKTAAISGLNPLFHTMYIYMQVGRYINVKIINSKGCKRISYFSGIFVKTFSSQLFWYFIALHTCSLCIVQLLTVCCILTTICNFLKEIFVIIFVRMFCC